MKLAVPLVCVLSGACSPVIQHGPWVEPGLSGSAGGSAFVGMETGEGAVAHPWLSIDGGMRIGIVVNDSSHEGVSLGFQLPLVALAAIYDSGGEDNLVLRLINLDGFIALPRMDDLNPAVGITVSSLHTMPYLQVGKYDKWYTTHGLALITEGGWLYSPSFTAVRVNSPTSRTHLTLSTGLGGGGGDIVWMGGFSITFEFTRARN